MRDWVAHNEQIVRLGAFALVFFGMAAWELAAASRRLIAPKRRRWLANLGLLVLNTLLLRLLFPTAAVGMALLSSERGWGWLNNVALPFWLATVISVLLLDLAIYLQHVMFHAVPALWRLHMVHHADVDFDFTTGLRFHTLEIVLSMIFKTAVIAALGPPTFGVLIFEILLNATSMFNHGNVRLPTQFDRWLRWLVVTPDMHRVHHSTREAETNSNFGFNLPWWDRLLGTYQAQPAKGHLEMTIGLAQFQGSWHQNLLWLLTLPIRGRTGASPIHPRPSSDRGDIDGEI